MANIPYPLRFKPLFRDYLWGGRNLAARLNKSIPAEGSWAESWDLVDHADHESEVTNGPLAGRRLGQIMRESANWLLGVDHATERFPLLLKYLDCQSVLSVQVHPSDDFARRMNPPDLGKTEAWFIIDAAPNSVVYAGLRKGVNRENLADAIRLGIAEQCLHKIHPCAGDCLFIPAGTVHALGAGLLVAEIQQASNTTFRLFDWNRVDAQGKSRQLHVDQALETIDFSRGPFHIQARQTTAQPGRFRLVDCDKFVMDLVTQPGSTGDDGRFHILTVPTGKAEIRWDGNREPLPVGDTVLLPAQMPQVRIEVERGTTLLDMYLPN